MQPNYFDKKHFWSNITIGFSIVTAIIGGTWRTATLINNLQYGIEKVDIGMTHIVSELDRQSGRISKIEDLHTKN